MRIESERAVFRCVRPPLCRGMGRRELGQAGKAKFQRPCCLAVLDWPNRGSRRNDAGELQTEQQANEQANYAQGACILNASFQDEEFIGKKVLCKVGRYIWVDIPGGCQ